MHQTLRKVLIERAVLLSEFVNARHLTGTVCPSILMSPEIDHPVGRAPATNDTLIMLGWAFNQNITLPSTD